MPVVAGTSFTATLVGPGGVTSGVGARVEAPVTRAIVSMFELATLDDFTWSVTLESPLTAGDYNIVWMTTAPDDAQPDPFPIYVPLFVVDTADVTGITNVDWPPIDMPSITPTPDDVAVLEATRTRDESGAFHESFDTETEPTRAQVTTVIDQAAQLVVGAFPNGVDPDDYPRVKQAVTLLSAVIVEGSWFRNQDEQGGTTGSSAAAWRSLYNVVIANLQADVERKLRQALVMGTMEPRGLV